MLSTLWLAQCKIISSSKMDLCSWRTEEPSVQLWYSFMQDGRKLKIDASIDTLWVSCYNSFKRALG